MRYLCLLLLAAPLAAQSLAGVWDATVRVNRSEIPFRMEFSGSGPDVEGSFFNGEEKLTSTRGRFENNRLVLYFDYYAGKLEATWHDGRLTGSYAGPSGAYPFQAKRFTPSPVEDRDVPS